MQPTHEFLTHCPVDLYQLHLFRLVALSGNFTRAASAAGLTQSAITRQVQGIEAQLGVRLFERTTRRVVLTAAGEFLLRRSEAILSGMGQTLQQVREQFAGAPRILAVGVSRSVGLAYLPGFFVSYRRKHPAVRVRVSQQTSADILAGLEANQLHAGIVSVRARLPAGLEIAHHFEDDFVLVAPPDAPLVEKTATLREILSATAPRDWVLLDERSTTGRLLRRWLSAQGAEIRPVMEADTFDLIINLVTLGLGWSLVPKRALPLYPRARALRRVTLKPKLSRELAIVVRKDRARPEHVRWFVESILFGGEAASGSR